MSLNWYKTGGIKKAGRLSAGKFASKAQRAEVVEENDFYPIRPLVILAGVCIAIVFWVHNSSLEAPDVQFQVVANTALAVLIISTFSLFQRYSISHEMRRMYLTITFAIAGMNIVLFVVVLPLFTGDISTIQTQRFWGAYAVRLIFAFQLLVSTIVEHGDYKQSTANPTWFTMMGFLLTAALYGVVQLLPLPEQFIIGPIRHAEEILPLLFLAMSFGVILQYQKWRTNKILYHLLLILEFQIAGTVALSLVPGTTLDILSTTGYSLMIAGIVIPIVSIQTSMYRSYRYAEQHRIKENWMTRSSSETKGGQELSPIVFREIAQQLNEGLAITDVTGRIIFANAFMEKMTGLHSNELHSKTPAAWQHGTVKQEFYPQIFARIRKDKVMYEGTVKNAYPNNPKKEYDAALRITPVLDEFGEISCCVLQQRNISEDRERLYLMRQMIDNMPFGVIILEVPSMNISLINSQAEYLLSAGGFNIRALGNLEDLMGSLRTTDGKPYPKEKLPPYITVTTRKKAETEDISILSENGGSALMVWNMKTMPFFREDGRMHSMLIAFDDVSKHREYEHKMSDFVSVASHQLRTPLTSIKWSLDALRKKDSGMNDDDKQLMFDTCYTAAERMMMTIQQLLQVAELEGEDTGKHMKKVDIMQAIDESVKALKGMSDAKKLTFKQSVLKTIPPMHFSPMYLNQIVQNILENAVKYTPEGGEIDSILTVQNDNIEWTVHDTGIGISRESLGRLFEKFFRGDNAQRLYPDGTGLGLYIVKSTLDATGGSIRVESEEGKGTTVYVTIPLVQGGEEKQ